MVEETKSPRGSPRASSALRFGKKLRSKVKTAGAAAAKKAASVVSSKNVLVSAPDEASMNMWMEAFTPQAKGNMHFVRRSGMDDTTPAPDDWKPCLGLLYKSQLLLRDIEEYKLFASVALWNVQPGGVKIVEGYASSRHPCQCEPRFARYRVALHPSHSRFIASAGSSSTQ